MSKVKLDWRESDSGRARGVHRCEIRARNDEGALFMEVHDIGWAVFREYSATAYYSVAGRGRGIPLYDDEGFNSIDDAKEVLAEWYANHAPTLLMTLAA
ncbi:MAG: hypothetical protein OXO50_15930 [Caldilineaceae bacterium]|nr:hypothetical protein [Caldilineaceae bacterium]